MVFRVDYGSDEMDVCKTPRELYDAVYGYSGSGAAADNAQTWGEDALEGDMYVTPYVTVCACDDDDD